jgi:hypothetical protein
MFEVEQFQVLDGTRARWRGLTVGLPAALRVERRCTNLDLSLLRPVPFGQYFLQYPRKPFVVG